MRTEVGGANFDKTIGQKLFESMKECLQSFEINQETLDNDQTVTHIKSNKKKEVHKAIPGMPFKIDTQTQPYISSKILNAYKVVKESEAQKVILQQEKFKRENEQKDKLEVDETKKPIQQSKFDKNNKFSFNMVVPRHLCDEKKDFLHNQSLLGVESAYRSKTS